MLTFDDIIGAVKAKQKAEGLTMRALARKIDVHQSNLCRVFKGTHQVNAESLLSMIQYLEVRMPPLPWQR